MFSARNGPDSRWLALLTLTRQRVASRESRAARSPVRLAHGGGAEPRGPAEHGAAGARELRGPRAAAAAGAVAAQVRARGLEVRRLGVAQRPWNGQVTDWCGSHARRSNLAPYETQTCPPINAKAHYRYGLAQIQGRRPYMEDRHAVVADLNGACNATDGRAGDLR